MTVTVRSDGGPRLLQLLITCEQLRQWSEHLESQCSRGHRLAIAHGHDRGAEGEELAAAYLAPLAPLAAVERLEPHLRRGDLLLIVSSAGGGKPSLQSVGGMSALRGLLHRGVVIWGITGPRPNPVSPYCHDSLAVPESEPSILLRSHRLVVRQLVIARRFLPSATRLVTAHERSLG